MNARDGSYRFKYVQLHFDDRTIKMKASYASKENVSHAEFWNSAAFGIELDQKVPRHDRVLHRRAGHGADLPGGELAAGFGGMLEVEVLCSGQFASIGRGHVRILMRTLYSSSPPAHFPLPPLRGRC